MPTRLKLALLSEMEGRMTGTYDFADQALIDALPVREEPHWHVIRFCRHIGVAKTMRSEPQWVARFRTKTGGYRQKRLGLIFGDRALSYVEAMERASAWFSSTSNAEIASDPYDRGSKQDLNYCPWGPVFTIGHAMRDLVAWKRLAARKSTFDGHLSQINHHILPRIGTLPVAEFKGHQIKQFILDVLETPPKRGNQLRGSRRPFGSLNEEELRSRKGTVNVLVGILRTALKLAWENGETDDDRSWRCIRRLPNRAKSRFLYLDRSECSALLAVCRDDLKNLVLGALYTGCRVTELERLRVRDVATKVFGIYVEANKSGGPRFVFLPDEGLAFFLKLTRNRSSEDFVFKHQDGTDWRGRYKHLFRNAVREAGLPEGFVFHGLRHTYASQLIQAATPLLVVAQQLGHATADTVARTYGHMAPQLREMQVRRNFATIDSSYLKDRSICRQIERTEALSAKTPWREYGQVEQESSWPKSNFVKGVGWGYRADD